jgi:thymidine phosphorylase
MATTLISTEEIILRKRDGGALTADELRTFVTGIASGEVSDAQIAAFTMATWFNGMVDDETRALTLAMRDSGRVLDWAGLDGPVLDKHSTGGVGDLVSLVLGPLLAACGAYVPMISGRGLGHTGGTLDKLESIPGLHTALGRRQIREQVREIGIAIVGQTGELAPADRRIYAIRDVTATVSSAPLMISSILSKKLAEGLDGLVLDIKYGSGAFLDDPAEGVTLAKRMCAIAGGTGVPCNALVSSMDAPLASSAGNALEVREAIRLLRGEAANDRLYEVVITLAAELLVLGGLATSSDDGRAQAKSGLETGRAAERFAAMVAAQGGPSGILEEAGKLLPQARLVRPVYPPRDGFVAAIDTLAVGNTVVRLGGGRNRPGDGIDPAVGLDRIAGPGTAVGKNDPLAVIHARDEQAWENAASALISAFSLNEHPVSPAPVVHSIIKGNRAE